MNPVVDFTPLLRPVIVGMGSLCLALVFGGLAWLVAFKMLRHSLSRRAVGGWAKVAFAMVALPCLCIGLRPLLHPEAMFVAAPVPRTSLPSCTWVTAESQRIVQAGLGAGQYQATMAALTQKAQAAGCLQRSVDVYPSRSYVEGF